MNEPVSNKRFVYDHLHALIRANDKDKIAAKLYADDLAFDAFHPVNSLQGRQQAVEEFWEPLAAAMPDLERRDSILIAGEYEGRQFVSAMGHYQGTFRNTLFGVPATQGAIHLRYGEIHELQNGRIRHTHLLVDMLDLLRQTGDWPVAPSLGAEHQWPDPRGGSGVAPDAVDAALGASGLEVVLAMHQELFRFDGKRIDSMKHEQYWTEDFMWYGPAGIGTTRGLHGFRVHHQIPFLRAFPDRRGGHHIARVGDGNFVFTGGWPSVVATHKGPDWMGLPATGKSVGMRVMDFYRLEDGLIAENWVPIDIIDALKQLGTDVLERVRHLRGDFRDSL